MRLEVVTVGDTIKGHCWMAKRLKKTEVEQLAPRIRTLIENGRTKNQICNELDIFMGAVHLYLRDFAPVHIKELILSNGRGV